MTPEERELLKQTLALAEENNAILRKMRRIGRWGNIIKVFYWVLILALSFGAYIFAKPYVDQVQNIYTGVSTDLNQINNLKEGLHNLGR